GHAIPPACLVEARSRALFVRIQKGFAFMEALFAHLVKPRAPPRAGNEGPSQAYLRFRNFTTTAGRPALHGSEPGQVRKEAATAILCKCRGYGSPPITIRFSPASMPTMNLRRALTTVLTICAFAAVPAHALDSMSAEIGSGDSVDMGRVGAQWHWKARWFQGSRW